MVVVRLGEDAHSALADLPGELRFRLPATVEHGVVRFDGHEVGLDALQPEITLNPGEVAGLRGVYATPLGEGVLVSDREISGAATPFLMRPRDDGSHEVVRLHPTSARELLSEHGESVAVIPADHGGRPSLRIEGVGNTGDLTPIELYTEEPFAWQSGSIRLSGTLLLPFAETPAGCAVFMHGSSPTSREFYRLFAHPLVVNGLAALIFDKRGFGESGGAADSLLRDRAEDAAAAVRGLRNHPRIDPANIGLWAFSNGTWSAPMVAAGMEDVRFVVLVGAAGVSPAEAEIHRKVLELRDWHIPEVTIERVQRAWTLAYRCVVGEWDSAWDTEYDALIAGLHNDAQLTSIPLAEYVQRQPWLAPVPPNIPSAGLREMAFGQLPEMGYDPCTDLARTKAPVLFVVGEEDTNTPGREGAGRVREALEAAGNPASRVELIPGAGHFLNEMLPVSGMSTAEAAGELHRLRFVPGYFELVTNWVLEQLRR